MKATSYPEPSDWQKQLIANAATSRGQIIAAYANIEFVMTHLVICCQRLPEYAALAAKFPYRLETKISTVKAILNAPGPLAAYADEAAPLLDGIQKYSETRHFLVHGSTVLTTDLKGNHRFHHTH